jgi:hypothetical protein
MKGASPNGVQWKKAAQQLLPEIEAEVMDRLAGLRGILITYTLEAAGASHNVPVSGLSLVLRTEAMGTFNKPGAFYFEHDHVLMASGIDWPYLILSLGLGASYLMFPRNPAQM